MSRILMRYELWKSVEDYSGLGFGQKATEGLPKPATRSDSGAAPEALRACSACAGDYEDPDRTAWGPDADEDESGEEHMSGDEFPAQ
jgi:hypothetical protein